MPKLPSRAGACACSLVAALVGFLLLASAPGARALSFALAPGPVSGGVLAVDVLVAGLGDGIAPSLRSYDLDVAFDAGQLAFVEAVFDGYLGAPGLDALTDVDLASGVVDFASVSLLDTPTLLAGQPDAFRLATLRFAFAAPGTVFFSFEQTLAGDTGGGALAVASAPGLELVIVPEPGSAALLLLGGLALGAAGRRRSARDRFGPGLLLLLVVAAPAIARANCNLIPTALREYPSEQGLVDRAIAGPGDRVAVRVDPFCQLGTPGFDPDAADNQVVLRFEPPTGVTTDVAVSPSLLTPADCSGASCGILLIRIPDTDALLPPDGDDLGLAGAARILVARDGGATPVAEIATLFEPTEACDQEPEGLFRRFTVLPEANSFLALQQGTATTLRATLDGGENLLVPIDYTGALRAPFGAPIFSILEATAASVPAFSGGPPLRLPASGAIRSFSSQGRPLPPLLRVDSDGDTVFGSVDARRSVLRVQRENPGFPDFYDFTDRLFADRGPVLIPVDAATSREAAPLPSLRAGSEAVIFARDEAVEGNLNDDADTLDLVPQVLDPASGASVSTDRAVVQVTWPGFNKAILASDGAVVAYAESELRQNLVRNADGDLRDGILRVTDALGVERTGAQAIPVDPLPAIDGRPLVVAGDLVFFRTREADSLANPVVPVVTVPQLFSETPAEISREGRFVAFDTIQNSIVAGDTNAAWDVFVRDRDPDGDGVYDEAGVTMKRVSVATGNVQANGDSRRPALEAGGRFVAFDSAATSLVSPDTNGAALDVFVHDRANGSTVRVSNDAAGAQLAGPSRAPAIAAGGRIVAFESGGVVVVDRDADADGSFDEYGEPGAVVVSAPIAAATPALSEDGAVLAYTSSADLGLGKTTASVEVYWEERGGARRRMPTADGLEPNGDAQGPRLSADGRYLVFSSIATNLTPGEPEDALPSVYVYDALLDTVERLDDAAGRLFQDVPWVESSAPRISGDGRWVALQAVQGLFGQATSHAFLFDRATDEVWFADATSAIVGPTSRPSLSADGRHVAFASFQGLAVRSGAEDPNGDGALGPGVSLNPGDADGRDTVLQVFDATAGALRANARTPARVGAVAAGRVGVLSPEAEDPTLGNGDADREDWIAQLYDGATDALTSLGVAAERIAISEQVVCLAVPEAAQPGASNGDADDDDAVLGFWRIGQPVAELTLTDYTVDRDLDVLALGALGADCLFLSQEADGGAHTIRNADLDSLDRVLGIYSTASMALRTSPTAAPQARDLALGDSPTLAAFRSCEADDGGTDLNLDGDTLDCVMQTIELGGPSPVRKNTQRAAEPCGFEACDPFFEPYRVRGVTVSFLSEEGQQSGPGPGLPPHCAPTPTPGGCDFNGDGDSDDVTIQVFNVRAETAQSFLIDVATPPSVAPFPETSDDQTLLTVELPESAVGEDVDGDGDVDDTPVVVILGDADEDGSLDGSLGPGEPDNCTEAANPTQVDVDLDGLGDVVCDPNPFSFPPSGICDVDRNARIDQADVDLIFAARGAVAAPGNDVRDPDRSGRIDVLDAGLCADRCTYPSCRATPPTASCGLGAEGALALGVWAAIRRRRALRRERPPAGSVKRARQ